MYGLLSFNISVKSRFVKYEVLRDVVILELVPQTGHSLLPGEKHDSLRLGKQTFFYEFTFKRSGEQGISNLFSKIYPLAPAQFDYKKISNRELSLLLLNFNRREKIDVFANTQFKLQQNARYNKNISVEELDKIQRWKPELSEFIFLFFGLDRGDYTPEQIAELDSRLKTLPERLKLAKAKRPNLGEVFLSLRENKHFVNQLKKAIKKRLKEVDKFEVDKGSG